MLSQVVQDALNNQINMEFCSSYSYLAMSSYCAIKNFPGCANWLLVQSQEETSHAMKLREFLLDRDCSVVLHPIPAPPTEYDSIPAVFKKSLEQEMAVSRSIDELYDLAHRERPSPRWSSCNGLFRNRLKRRRRPATSARSLRWSKTIRPH